MTTGKKKNRHLRKGAMQLYKEYCVIVRFGGMGPIFSTYVDAGGDGALIAFCPHSCTSGTTIRDWFVCVSAEHS